MGEASLWRRGSGWRLRWERLKVVVGGAENRPVCPFEKDRPKRPQRAAPQNGVSFSGESRGARLTPTPRRERGRSSGGHFDSRCRTRATDRQDLTASTGREYQGERRKKGKREEEGTRGLGVVGSGGRTLAGPGPEAAVAAARPNRVSGPGNSKGRRRKVEGRFGGLWKKGREGSRVG